MTMNLNRRNLLKGAAASAAVLPFASAHALQADKSTRWDKDCDVLVVGYGGAGAAAAIEAHDAGAKVLVIEKMAEGGGNTAVSSGGFMVPKDKEEAYKFLNALYTLSNSEKDEALIRRYCDEVQGSKEWLLALKPNTKATIYGHAGHQTLPGADTIDKWRISGKKRGGDNLFDQYRYAVEDVRRIEVMLETPAERLIKRGDEIVGVTAISGGKKINIRAKRAVILATGGYENDPQSQTTFTLGKSITVLGNPGNTGDGLRMAQQAGARLWHMTALSCPVGMQVPGLKTSIQLNILAPSHFWVDQDGKRFVNEKGLDNHTIIYAVNELDPIHKRFPRIPCWLVFDEKARKTGPICGGATSGYALNREGYKWSADNSKEIEAGVIKKADTIKALAKMINVPEDALQATFDKWNADIKAGADTLFGRPLKKQNKKVMFAGREAPIVSEPLAETGPYYAVPLVPTMLNTQGGPKKDVEGHVMDPFDQPVPRLYVAGELGSMWPNIYQGATNNSECLVFGRIAGRSAAAEKPWA